MALSRGVVSTNRFPVVERTLDRKLGLPEAIGLSLSIVGPSMAMAFNMSLAVRAAGRAAPLAFAVGTLSMGFVALSFVKFSRRVAHAGSAFAYIGQAFGQRWGFLAGWTLLLTYLTYAAGVTAVIGNFVQAAAHNYGLQQNGVWFAATAAGLLLASVCAYRDVKLAGRLMLVLEALSIVVILFLCLTILVSVAGTAGLSSTPFMLAADKHWSGIGYALVFCLLSFAGFEGAATLGEGTRNPHRNIPIAILGTCILAGAFYVFVTYAQVMGFGVDSTDKLADASEPLNDLATMYVSRNFATTIDLAAVISAFSCVLGALSAAARLLFALGRAGLGPRLANVHPVHGTTAVAFLFTGLLCIGGLVLCAPLGGPAKYCTYLLTIGTLALILVYIGVNAPELADSFGARRVAWSICGLAGAGVLLWSFYDTLYPPQAFPNNLWPYLVAMWVIAGSLLVH